MSADNAGGFQLSQDYEVIKPRAGKAYPVPCKEWDFLKGKLRTVSTPPWLLRGLGFLFLGAAVATLTAILSGGVAAGPEGNGVTFAWSAFATTGVVGLACLYLAYRQMKMEGTRVSEVIRQMELIEERFPSE